MRWPRSGPSQVAVEHQVLLGTARGAITELARTEGEGGTPSMRGSPGSSAKEPIPKVPAGSPSRSCAAAEPRSGGSAAATMLGRPCASTSNLQGMTKRCVPAAARHPPLLWPIAGHRQADRYGASGPESRTVFEEECPDAADGFLERAALSRPSPAVNAVGRSGSSSSMPTAAQASWKMFLFRIVVVCLGPVLAPHRGGHHRVGRARGRACHCASSVWRGGVRR